jgi:hypothetical protein
MRDILDSIDGIPTFIRVLILIPLIDIFTFLFRILKHLLKGEVVPLLKALFTFAFRVLFVWIPGLLYMVITGKLFRND